MNVRVDIKNYNIIIVAGILFNISSQNYVHLKMNKSSFFSTTLHYFNKQGACNTVVNLLCEVSHCFIWSMY